MAVGLIVVLEERVKDNEDRKTKNLNEEKMTKTRAFLYTMMT